MNREAVIVALLTAAINGAVTWGVVSTKLDWLRRDVDLAHSRLDKLIQHERLPYAAPR